MSLLGAAKRGTLTELRSFYEPGDARREFSGGTTLLAQALGNPDPVRRREIASFLLDEGADATWTDPRQGSTLLHVLLGKYRDDVTPADGALLRRLLDAGADPDAVDRRWGTPLQTLHEKAVSWGETSAGPYYDVLLGRDDLDLFRAGSFGLSTYTSAARTREQLPELWRRVQQYVADHGLQVPADQVDA